MDVTVYRRYVASNGLVRPNICRFIISTRPFFAKICIYSRGARFRWRRNVNKCGLCCHAAYGNSSGVRATYGFRVIRLRIQRVRETNRGYDRSNLSKLKKKKKIWNSNNFTAARSSSGRPYATRAGREPPGNGRFAVGRLYVAIETV